MEKTMSVEEKIRRAEEIYFKRNSERKEQSRTQKVPVNLEKKDIKLFKKMIIQIIICILIYMVIYTIQNCESIFSENVISKTKEILEYDTNFFEIYENLKNSIITLKNSVEKKEGDNEQNNILNQNDIEEQDSKQETSEQPTDAIGGAVDEQKNIENVQLSQEENDIQNIKNTTTFIKPVEGTISSPYGYRGKATGSVPKNHTGTDIAANLGTKIRSATDGEVVLVSEEGDYGKHVKIQIGEVSIIYAHCNSIYIKQGEHIIQGQEIAEVGTTGNSTGPHLHFEIRYQERTIDSQKILEI